MLDTLLYCYKVQAFRLLNLNPVLYGLPRRTRSDIFPPPERHVTVNKRKGMIRIDVPGNIGPLDWIFKVVVPEPTGEERAEGDVEEVCEGKVLRHASGHAAITLARFKGNLHLQQGTLTSRG